MRSVVLQILAFGIGAAVQAEESDMGAPVDIAPEVTAPAEASPEVTTPVEVSPEVRTLLSEPVPESEYTDGRNCLSAMAVERTEILDSSHILFIGRGDRVWLNQLRRPCVGLQPNQVLAFDLTNARFCRLDRFRALDTVGLHVGPPVGRTSGLAGTGAICVLNRFEPVSSVHSRVIREALIRKRETELETPEEAPVEN